LAAISAKSAISSPISPRSIDTEKSLLNEKETEERIEQLEEEIRELREQFRRHLHYINETITEAPSE